MTDNKARYEHIIVLGICVVFCANLVKVESGQRNSLRCNAKTTPASSLNLRASKVKLISVA